TPPSRNSNPSSSPKSWGWPCPLKSTLNAMAASLARTFSVPRRAGVVMLSHMTTVGQTDEKPTGRTLFGHPIGLANLFGVELWERFSFYGMLTILAYYLYYSLTDGGLELPKATATGIVGAYGGLVYLSTVLGGWIADRVLGMERTVLY